MKVLKVTTRLQNITKNKEHPKLIMYIPKLFREFLQLKPKDEVQLTLKGKYIIISKNNKE
jgi:hypothetical protein